MSLAALADAGVRVYPPVKARNPSAFLKPCRANRYRLCARSEVPLMPETTPSIVETK